MWSHQSAVPHICLQIFVALDANKTNFTLQTFSEIKIYLKIKTKTKKHNNRPNFLTFASESRILTEIESK
jgi:hypothetical protein